MLSELWLSVVVGLLRHLSLVVIDRIGRADGRVVIAARPRAGFAATGDAIGCRLKCSAATDGIWRINRSLAVRSRWF